jgi:hypothetical protein
MIRQSRLLLTYRWRLSFGLRDAVYIRYASVKKSPGEPGLFRALARLQKIKKSLTGGKLLVNASAKYLRLRSPIAHCLRQSCQQLA